MKSSTIDLTAQTKSETKELTTSRFMMIGLWPGYGSTKPCIRLQGNWLREAGFIPRWRVKVTVSPGKLLLEPIDPANAYLG